jgi:hypothetical protein
MFSYIVRLTLLLEQAYPDIVANVVVPLLLQDQDLWKDVLKRPKGQAG